jgi:DNA-binding CsgD family transcriptional regulator
MARKATSTDPVELMERLSGLKFAAVVERIAALSPQEFDVFRLLGECETTGSMMAQLGGISQQRLAYLRRRVLREFGTDRHLIAAFWLFRVGSEIRPEALDEARKRRDVPAPKEVKTLEEWRK